MSLLIRAFREAPEADHKRGESVFAGLGKLLGEADEAANPATNGVLDRNDLQQIISRLGAAVRRLVEHSETLQLEHEILAERLESCLPIPCNASETDALHGQDAR